MGSLWFAILGSLGADDGPGVQRRCAIRERGVHRRDPGVHDAAIFAFILPIAVFTFGDLSVHVRPI